MKTILFLMAFLSLGSMAQVWGGGPGHLVFSCRGYDQNLHDQFSLSRHERSRVKLTNRENDKTTSYIIRSGAAERTFTLGLSKEMDSLHTNSDYMYFTGTLDQALYIPGGRTDIHLYVAKDERRLSHMYTVRTYWDGANGQRRTTISDEHVFDCAFALH